MAKMCDYLPRIAQPFVADHPGDHLSADTSIIANAAIQLWLAGRFTS
jgi:hypothetical protein